MVAFARKSGCFIKLRTAELGFVQPTGKAFETVIDAHTDNVVDTNSNNNSTVKGTIVSSIALSIVVALIIVGAVQVYKLYSSA